MANHVHSVIEFHKINDEAKAKLVSMYGRCREGEYGRKWFGDLFVNEDLTYDMVEQYSWTTENIGPKWCYIEEFDEESLMMVTNSAWSAPEDGVGKLVEILNVHDDDIVWSIKYEDEMPNFIGAYVYRNDDCIDGAEDDSEEIYEMIMQEHEHLREHWDEEEDYWKCDEDGNMTDEAESAQEEFQEIQYEWISDRLDSLVSEALEQIEEEA
jgi:hypothetical protein